VQELGVIDAKRWRLTPEVHQPRHVGADPLSPRISIEPVKVHRIDLLVGVAHGQVVLVGELLTGQNERYPDRGKQTGKGQLDPLLGANDAVVVQELIEALVPEPSTSCEVT
jgi:hypothetical protein